MGDLIVYLPQEKRETEKASQIEGCLHLDLSTTDFNETTLP